MSSASALEQITLIVQQATAQNYCIAANFALLLYDWSITIGQEFEVVWHRRLTSANILYVLNRYLAMSYLVLQFVIMLSAHCKSLYILGQIANGCGCLFYLVVAVISALRVYAISGRDWRVSSVVFLFGSVPFATNIYRYTTEVLVTFTLPPPLHTGCTVVAQVSLATSDKLTIVTRVSAIVSDALVLLATWRATYSIKRTAERMNVKVSMITLLLRDGTIYFGVLFGLNVIQIILYTTDALAYSSLFITLITSILLSRFFLNLRQVHSPKSSVEDTLVTSSHVSDLHFASGVVANMGAPLRTGPAFSEGADLSVSISSLDELSSIAGSRFAQTDGDEWDAFYEVPRVVKEPLKDGLGLLNDEIVLQPLERDPEELTP